MQIIKTSYEVWTFRDIYTCSWMIICDNFSIFKIFQNFFNHPIGSLSCHFSSKVSIERWRAAPFLNFTENILSNCKKVPPFFCVKLWQKLCWVKLIGLFVDRLSVLSKKFFLKWQQPAIAPCRVYYHLILVFIIFVVYHFRMSLSKNK